MIEDLLLKQSLHVAGLEFKPGKAHHKASALNTVETAIQLVLGIASFEWTQGKRMKQEPNQSLVDQARKFECVLNEDSGGF